MPTLPPPIPTQPVQLQPPSYTPQPQAQARGGLSVRRAGPTLLEGPQTFWPALTFLTPLLLVASVWVSCPGQLWTHIVVFLALQPSNSSSPGFKRKDEVKGMRKNKKRKCERRAGRRKSRRQIRARTPATPGFFFFGAQENPKPEKSMEVAISACEHNSRDKSMGGHQHIQYRWPERNSARNGPVPQNPRMSGSSIRAGAGAGAPVGQAMHVIPGGIVHIVFSVKGGPWHGFNVSLL